MQTDVHRDVQALRDAMSNPTWVDVAGYSLEKVHTNTLARALEQGTLASHALAAAMWTLATAERLDASTVTAVQTLREHKLGKGAGSVVDLCVRLRCDDGARSLAIEVKVDGAPDGAQLKTMADALSLGPRSALVLMCLGSAQVCRLEDEHRLGAQAALVRRWAVRDVLTLAERVEAASPSAAVARGWIEELRREEARRCVAHELISPHGLGFRPRLIEAYRYAHAAAALTERRAGAWNLSAQPFGVVMSELPSRKRLPTPTRPVTLYLEVVDGVLRVKAGAWDGPVDLRAATDAATARVRDAMKAAGFTVEATRKTSGSSVTLLSLDPQHHAWEREAFCARLQRAFAAWSELSLGS